MSTLPPSATLYQWARERRLRPHSYFHELAQHWQPVAKSPLRTTKRTPKNYLGLQWQGMHATQRERAAYQMLKKG
jgi:hypothetical protein